MNIAEMVKELGLNLLTLITRSSIARLLSWVQLEHREMERELGLKFLELN